VTLSDLERWVANGNCFGRTSIVITLAPFDLLNDQVWRGNKCGEGASHAPQPNGRFPIPNFPKTLLGPPRNAHTVFPREIRFWHGDICGRGVFLGSATPLITEAGPKRPFFRTSYDLRARTWHETSKFCMIFILDESKVLPGCPRAAGDKFLVWLECWRAICLR